MFQSTTFRPGCPSHFQVSNRKKKMPTFLNLLVLILELSGRCGASSRRSCGNVTFGVDVGVLCIKRSVSRVTEKHEDGRSTKKRKIQRNNAYGKKTHHLSYSGFFFSICIVTLYLSFFFCASPVFMFFSHPRYASLDT